MTPQCRLVCIVVCATVAVVKDAQASPDREMPNIVVVFTDDHGYADLSAQGIAFNAVGRAGKALCTIG